MNSGPDFPPVPSAGVGGAGSADGPARLAWLDGVLSGLRDGSDAPRRAAAEIATAGVGTPNVEIDGGRFSLLLSAEAFAPAAAGPGYLEAVERALRELAASSPQPGSVTSTVRCTEVFMSVVRETAFIVRSGELHRLERFREPRPDDVARRTHGDDAPPWAAAASFGRRRLALVGGLAVVLCSVVAWTGGYVDLLFAPDAGAMARDLGPFGDALAIEAEPSFGRYAVKVKRGAGYPRDREAADRLRAAASTPADLAAAAAIFDGGTIFVRVDGEDGKPLAVASVSLRPLSLRDDAEVEATLPGRIGGRRIALALESGR